MIWCTWQGLITHLGAAHHILAVQVVYASSHTFMNHGSHYTLMAIFKAHDTSRLDIVQLIMVGDQEMARTEDLADSQVREEMVILGCIPSQ